MIKNIRILNFKSLREVDVDLGPLTVLIGRSGTGKSNFANAFGFFGACLVDPQNAVARWGGESLLCATALPPEPARSQATAITFVLRFDAPGYNEDFVYELQVAIRGTGVAVLAEALTFERKEIFRRLNNKWVTAPAVLPLPDPSQLALQTANGIPEIARAYFVLTEGIGSYNFQGNVLQQPVQNTGGHISTGLSREGGNYLQVFQDINRNLQDFEAQKQIIAAMRQLNPALSSIQVTMPNANKVKVSLSARERTLTLDLAQESEGFRRFLAHLIAIYQLPPKQILIFDEPEKGLYPGALAALADQFRSCPDAGRGQVVVTTHNPALLDHFQPDEVRVVDIEQFETKIGRVSKPQIESIREQLMTTGELLTVDPARIETPVGEPK
jgi:predicted ATPase